METQQFMDATNNNFLTSYFFFFGGDLSLTTKRSLNDFITRHGGIVTANYSIDKDLHFIVQGTHSTSHDDSLLNSYRKRPLYLINQLWIRECEKNRSIVDMKPFLIKEILPALTKRQQIQLNKNVLSSSTLSHNNNYFSKSSSTSKLVANTIQAAVVSSSSSASNFSRKNSGGGVGGIVIKASRRQNSASNLLNLDDFLFKNNTSTQSNSAIG